MTDYRLHVEDKGVRDLCEKGSIGLERESLRITPDGHMAKTPDPFKDEEYIVKDFCENQTEINTPVCDSIKEVMDELKKYSDIITDTLSGLPEPEYIWPFSNPPYIVNEADIPIAVYSGKDHYKQEYREYLSERYGRYKMAFSGVHFNYSFSEDLLRYNHLYYEEFKYESYRDFFYLELGAKAQAYNWVVVALTAASPLLDSSYVEKGVLGFDIFNGMGSTRCSELGYWNYFTPILDYTHISNYAESILSYIERGLIRSAAELYFPVRLKSFHEYSPCSLCEDGVSHIELRMIDLNPLTPYGIDERDVEFIKLFLIWLAFLPALEMGAKEQVMAIQNTKNAARYDLKTVNIMMPDNRSMRATDALGEVLRMMEDFYERVGDNKTHSIIEYQKEKLVNPEARYAWQIRKEFGGGFVEKGLKKISRV